LAVTARLFGLVAIILGSSYLSEGVHWLLGFASGATGRSPFRVQYQTAVIALDLLIGAASILSGVGLVLLREWGRVCWLVTLSLTLLLHVVMMLAQLASGIDVRRSYVWVTMLVAVTILSWAYLTRRRPRARFR
jgi:hypothetical protein